MPNKVYVSPETARTWSDSGTTSDELLDLGGLAADAVAMGSFWDRGAVPYSEWIEAEMLIDGFATAPVVGQGVVLYVAQSQATTGFDGAVSTDPTDTVEGTCTLNQAKNLLYVKAAVVYSTTAGDQLRVRAIFRSAARYVSPVVHNDCADALKSVSDAHLITLRPIPPQVQ